ncbi:methyltransferase [Peziza echinospora]|nr:methyltransferase [Peziza echinospora]
MATEAAPSSPPAAAAPVGVAVDTDEAYGEGDSGVDSDYSTATTSLSSSIFSFTYANGRRYHSDRFAKADYFLPNDEAEQERLDLYHHIFLALNGGKLYSAPLENPQRVLDVGTGTGIWAMDFADEFESAEVIGIDISPIQPSWVPPNLKFEVDDVEEDWNFPEKFDYIHLRSLSGCIADWERLLSQAYAALKPGGWIEFQDYSCEMFHADGTPLLGIQEKHPFSTYMHHIVEAGAAAGRDLVIGRKAKGLFEKAGFQDVNEVVKTWPLGTWPKDPELKKIGAFGLLGAIQSAPSFALALLTEQRGWSADQVKKLSDDVIATFKKPYAKYYSQGYYVWGQKPL